MRVVLIATLVLASAAHAQTLPGGWELVGNSPLQASAIAFTGDPDDPTVLAGHIDEFAVLQPGQRWQTMPIETSAWGLRVILPLSPDTLFVGGHLHRSVDGGQTFERLQSPVASGPPDPIPVIGSWGTLVRMPAGAPHAGRLIAGDMPSVVVSDDGGDTWARPDEAPEAIVRDLLVHPSGDVFAATQSGVLVSRDGGDTFGFALNGAFHDRFRAFRLLLLDGLGRAGDPEAGRLAAYGTASSGEPQAWTSDDRGETWVRRASPFFGNCARPPALASLGPAAGGALGWAAAVGCVGLVHVTSDGGETWTEVGIVPGSPAEGQRTLVEGGEVGPDGRLYVGLTTDFPAIPMMVRTQQRLATAVGVPVAGERGPEAIPDAAPALTVWPNPARGAVTVSGAAGEAVVMDALGREVARASAAQASAEGRWRLDVSGWAPGLYRVRGTGKARAATFTVAR